MKASVKDLSNALKRIMPFVGSEKTFENILIDTKDNVLTIKALSSIGNAKIKLNVESDKDMSFVIKGIEFNNIINTFKDFINIELENNFIIISEKKSKIKLNVMKSSCFPENLSDIDTEAFEVSSMELINGLKNSLDFTEIKSMNIISGINIDFNDNILTVSATDGNRLSITEFKINSNIKQNITIPLSIAREIIKIEEREIKISISNRLIKFDFGDFVIVSNLITGAYPLVRKFIPNNYSNKLKCKKMYFEDILKKVALLDTKKQVKLKMKLSENLLNIDYVNADNNSLNQVLDVDYKGEDLEVCLNYEYLGKAIKNCEDEVNFEFGNTNSAILIKNNNNTMLIMPIQAR